MKPIGQTTPISIVQKYTCPELSIPSIAAGHLHGQGNIGGMAADDTAITCAMIFSRQDVMHAKKHDEAGQMNLYFCRTVSPTYSKIHQIFIDISTALVDENDI